LKGDTFLDGPFSLDAASPSAFLFVPVLTGLGCLLSVAVEGRAEILDERLGPSVSTILRTPINKSAKSGDSYKCTKVTATDVFCSH
jgi:hypothetical protein